MEDVQLKSNSELLKELKKLAEEKNIRRRDDEFLKRFLIGSGYNVSKAFKVLCNYENFTNRNNGSSLNWQKSRLKEIIETDMLIVFDKCGQQNQKVIWIRVDKWDTKKCTADELLELADLLCELSYQQEVERYETFDMILDLKNLSLKHLSVLSPAFAKRMIHYVGECVPMRITNIYITRQSRIFYLVFAIFKPFLDEHIKNIINICGDNFDSLISNIGREMLPVPLGGENENISAYKWIDCLNNNNTEKKLENAGYQFY